MDAAADLTLFFSPVSRLMHTVPPSTLKSEYGVVSTEPCFAFGSGELNRTPIENMDELLKHVSQDISGAHLVRLSCIDHNSLLKHCMKYGLSISDGIGTTKINGSIQEFAVDREAALYAKQTKQRIQTR